MRHVTITVRAPDVKDVQPLVADLIKEQWIRSLKIRYLRISDDEIAVSDRNCTWLLLANSDPYITLTATL